MTSTWWEHRKKELELSLWILAFVVLAQAFIIILTNGTRVLPIAGACLAAVVLIYELVQYDLHMRKKD